MSSDLLRSCRLTCARIAQASAATPPRVNSIEMAARPVESSVLTGTV